MAECFTINREEIEGRLDPLFYSHDVLAQFKKTKYDTKVIGEIAEYLKTGFAAGANEQSEDNTGIIQIRPTNIDGDTLLTFERNIYVKVDFLNKKPNDLLQKEEVLFNNTNSQDLVGKTAYFDLEGKYFCSNHITRIKVKREIILPKYLWIILNIYQKKGIFFNLCTNWNNQSGVNIELLKTIKIPLPSLGTQAELIKTIESAFKTRKSKEAEVRKLLDSIDDFLLEELGIKLPHARDKKCFVILADKIESSRLDPCYYQEKFIVLIDILSKIKCKIYNLGELIVDMSGGATPRVEESYYTDRNRGVPFLRVQNITKEGLVLEDVKYITKEVHNGMLKRSQLNHNDLVFTITGRIGSVAVIPEGFEGNINQHSVRFHLRNEINGVKINPLYVATYLNSEIGNKLSNRGITGGTRPALDYDYIKSIRIPIPTLEIQSKVAEEVKKRIQKAEQLHQGAKELVEKAKAEVENILLK